MSGFKINGWWTPTTITIFTKIMMAKAKQNSVISSLFLSSMCVCVYSYFICVCLGFHSFHSRKFVCETTRRIESKQKNRHRSMSFNFAFFGVSIVYLCECYTFSLSPNAPVDNSKTHRISVTRRTFRYDLCLAASVLPLIIYFYFVFRLGFLSTIHTVRWWVRAGSGTLIPIHNRTAHHISHIFKSAALNGMGTNGQRGKQAREIETILFGNLFGFS